MSAQTTYDLARVWYHDRMTEDWVPPSPTEAEAIFRRFGLTDAFWQLT